MTTERQAQLVNAAENVRQFAAATYSGYQVGCAILGEDGQVYVGCNYENVCYPAGLCAERNALGSMIAAGCLHWTALVVATKDGGTPCGICRQALAEFVAGAGTIICVGAAGQRLETSLAVLFPAGFSSDAVNKSPTLPNA